MTGSSIEWPKSTIEVLNSLIEPEKSSIEWLNSPKELPNSSIEQLSMQQALFLEMSYKKMKRFSLFRVHFINSPKEQQKSPKERTISPKDQQKPPKGRTKPPKDLPKSPKAAPRPGARPRKSYTHSSKKPAQLGLVSFI
jgi:hypothetical protein